MIYVLTLVENKYYVGYSERTDSARIQQHFKGNGSEWTKKYPPLDVIHIQDGSVEDENKKTLELMSLYGYNNVRGGKWTTTNDYKSPPKELVNMTFNYKVVLCAKCKRTGHEVGQCIWNVDVDGDTIMN